MLISYNWIKKFIPSLKATPEEVKEKLSVTLAEVEKVEPRGKDFILEIENKALTHRPDCFGQYGLAREVAAAFDLRLERRIPGSEDLDLPKEKIDLSRGLKAKLSAPNLCFRYSAVVLTGVKVASSPDWLKTAVEHLGIRPISNVVDITNFVMLETGQPLHAFDASKLRMKNGEWQVEIRSAQKNEKLTTLDGQIRKLRQGMLLVCDANSLQSSYHPTIQLSKPIALAGIMGGKETEVNAGTTDIVLESANFEPFNNRATSRALGLRTEASLRFEKGLDPNLTEVGIKRAIQLLTEVCQARLGSRIMDLYPKKVETKTIIIDPQRTNEFLGVDLSIKEIQQILNRLQIALTLQPSNPPTLQLSIPTFRRDLNISQDISEEVARIYGLNNIRPTIPTRTLSPSLRNRGYDLEQKIKEVLKGLGFIEAYTYSFVKGQATGSKGQEQLALQSPISPELNSLRTSLVPSLTEKTRENAKRFDEVKIFEVGKVTIPQGDQLPDEPKKIAGVWYNKKQQAGGKRQSSLYYKLKGDLERLFEEIGLSLSRIGVQRDDSLSVVELSVQDELMGVIYLLDLQTLAFELEFEVLLRNWVEYKEFRPIFPHPPVKLDLSIAVDRSVLAAQVVKLIKESGGELLVEAEPFDLFEDEKSLGRNKKSMAFHLAFQSKERSLTLKEVQPFVEKITKSLTENLRAVVR